MKTLKDYNWIIGLASKQLNKMDGDEVSRFIQANDIITEILEKKFLTKGELEYNIIDWFDKHDGKAVLENNLIEIDYDGDEFDIFYYKGKMHWEGIALPKEIIDMITEYFDGSGY